MPLDLNDLGLFRNLQESLRKRLEKTTDNPKKFIAPSEYDAPAQFLVQLYLETTPFKRIFEVQLPFEISPILSRYQFLSALFVVGDRKLVLGAILLQRSLDYRLKMLLRGCSGHSDIKIGQWKIGKRSFGLMNPAFGSVSVLVANG